MDHPQQRNRNQDAGPSLVTSPYNFAPLPDKVVFPEWAERVSQDLPFRDGISGSIEIELEAKTPLYVRSGEETVDAKGDLKPSDEFFALGKDGDYAIPGTSLKGVIRSALSILTFGKLNPVDDRRQSVRDLSNRTLYSKHFTYEIQNPDGGRQKLWEPAAQGGFVYEDGDRWILRPCSWARVRHDDLGKCVDYAGNLPREFAEVSAERKYDVWNKNKYSLNLSFDGDGPTVQKDKFYFELARNLGSGKREGRIVFTGNPSGKKNKDFIFAPDGRKPIDVSHLRKDFVQANEVDGKPTESWAYWKRKLGRKDESGKKQFMPVFWLENENGNPASLGLASMYRLPYKYSIGEVLERQRPDNASESLDFAETIFGRVSNPGETTKSLKGRISFESLIAQGSPEPTSVIDTVLGGPKPSFYPNYVQQKQGTEPGKVPFSKGGKPYPLYTTCMDEDARLRGWKRYPVRPDGNSPNPSRPTTEKVGTSFRPLPEGTNFRGRIRIHNLRPVELGALLWTLAWGGKENLRHSVGMAKPLGFGSVSITISEESLKKLGTNDGSSAISAADYMALFEEYMKQQENAGSGWLASPTMKEILAMADSSHSIDPELLAYPVLDPDRRKDDFRKLKNPGGRYLLPYTLLSQRRA